MRNEKCVALVTPWFGEDGTGGSQILSTQLVRELFAPAEGIDVLTTCSRSFEDDWSKNYYNEGTERARNVTIRRFGVRARDTETFNRANGFLLSQPPGWLRNHTHCIPETIAAAFCAENIASPDLLKYLADWGRGYKAVIFTPYLYGPILSGVELVADRAYLQPCLHDEAYAYLPQVKNMFHAAKGLLFNSESELALAQRLYDPAIVSKSFIVGHWVDEPSSSVKSEGRRGIPREPFILYVGRTDSTKNVDAVAQAFLDYRRYRPASRLQLVLAGNGTMQIPAGPGIVSLGTVSDARKRRLLSTCLALVQPSMNESFSRTVMEAWSYGKPVAVNGKCEPTSAAVSECGGGWVASSTHEWIDVFSSIDRAGEKKLQELGERGRQYYFVNGTAERVLERYRVALDLDRSASHIAARG
jgi:glycosyltransferase involved in cell wall biosynthesis